DNNLKENSRMPNNLASALHSFAASTRHRKPGSTIPRRTVKMKPHLLILPALALALVFGCQDTPENNEAKKEIKEASDATVQALKAQKGEYKKQFQADLDKFDITLKEYKEKASKAKDDAKVKMNKQIEAL